ncbi:hypothetical protein [Microbulbifer sp. MCCC 1A16149]|uniref:hypothetical protein n=1 Tax=Microbulbifer sp. MCCC 1A16149 TaxID=3411322 RepID=UPI003D0FEA14
MKFHVELNENEEAISLEELPAWLDQVEIMDKGELWLGKGGKANPWWKTFLGLQPQRVEPLLSLEWCGNGACLYFHDENWSEYRVLSKNSSVQFSQEVRAAISHGEENPAPHDECIEKSIAFSAVRESIKCWERPTWLEYRYVE